METCHGWVRHWLGRGTVPGLLARRSHSRSHQCTASVPCSSHSILAVCIWTRTIQMQVPDIQTSRFVEIEAPQFAVVFGWRQKGGNTSKWDTARTRHQWRQSIKQDFLASYTHTIKNLIKQYDEKKFVFLVTCNLVFFRKKTVANNNLLPLMINWLMTISALIATA